MPQPWLAAAIFLFFLIRINLAVTPRQLSIVRGPRVDGVCQQKEQGFKIYYVKMGPFQTGDCIQFSTGALTALPPGKSVLGTYQTSKTKMVSSEPSGQKLPQMDGQELQQGGKRARSGSQGSDSREQPSNKCLKGRAPTLRMGWCAPHKERAMSTRNGSRSPTKALIPGTVTRKSTAQPTSTSHTSVTITELSSADQEERISTGPLRGCRILGKMCTNRETIQFSQMCFATNKKMANWTISARKNQKDAKRVSVIQ